MKRRYIILITLAALAGGVFLYFKLRSTKDFEPLIKSKLADMVSKASNGLYQLDIGHIAIDIASGSVLATDVLLTPDSVRMAALEQSGQLGNTVVTVSLTQLNLEGLTPMDLINNKSISLNQLVIDSPEVKIAYKKRSIVKKDSGNLYERIAGKGQFYSVGKLLLNHIKLTVISEGKTRQVSSFKDLSASFTDIRIDSTTTSDSTRFLFARDAVILFKAYKAVSEKGKYNFTIDSMALRPQQGSMAMYDIKLKPIGTKDQFSAKLDKMEDQYDIHVKHAAVKNINWFGLLAEDGFFGDEMEVNGGYVHVYDDRRLPSAENKEGNFPHQMLMKVKLPVYMAKLQLKDLDIVYEEFNPKSNNTGKVAFSGVSGTITNITNMPEHIATNANLTIKANASLMDAGQMQVGFLFHLDKVKSGSFETDVLLGAMDGKKMNATTEGLGLVKINELQIDKLEAHLQGTNTQAHGQVKFAYHDLAVDILKADEDGNTKKRGLLTFIAKNFLLKKSSPAKAGEPVKEYAVAFTRDKQKSFFNLIWKTIFMGLKQSVRGK